MPYNTIAEANSYFSSRFGFDDWALLTDPIKTMALNSANQILDLLCKWNGSKTDENQANEFPRDGSLIVPDAVKFSELEIAYSIIKNNSNSTSSDNPLEELKAGSVSFKFQVSIKDGNPLINNVVKVLLADLGICDFNMMGGSSKTIPIYRG